jgi:hypothetical protein
VSAAAAGTIDVGNNSAGSTIAALVAATGTAPTGTVSVTENVLATQAGAVAADVINVKGGTTVSVTANLNETAGAGNTVTGGAINVLGTAATTSVTVNQTAAVKAAAAVTATAGSAAVTAVTAAPGVTGVATAAATSSAAAKAAVAGVADGAVTVRMPATTRRPPTRLRR